MIFKVSLESTYTSKIDLEHRKKFAQFFTPEPISILMSKWVTSIPGPKNILEPAFGLGVFSRSILNDNSETIRIKGFEIDDIIFKEAETYFKSLHNVTLISKDYIFNDWDNKYNAIICNPPYFKFHDYDNKNVIREIKDKMNVELSGFTNLYTIFIIKSVFQLSQNGRAAYIVPSEFMNSDYGTKVKQYLIDSGVLRHIFVFDFKENIFDDAITTACILFLARDNHSAEVNFSIITNSKDLSKISAYTESYPNGVSDFKYRTEELDSDIKWTRYYKEQNSIKFKNLVAFSNYAKVQRGIATGANGYFKFNLSKAEKYSIDESNLIPCLTAAKHLKGSTFVIEDYNRLVENDEYVFLFNGAINSNEYVEKYIQIGEESNIHKKYLTSKRTPWFSIENRPPSPIWVSVFNREGVQFIRNFTDVRNLTNFHCVYPKENVDIDLLFSYLLTDVAKEIFSDNRREYGKGLEKFEPNDLNKANMLDIQGLNEGQKSSILKSFNDYLSTKEMAHIKAIDSLFREIFEI